MADFADTGDAGIAAESALINPKAPAGGGGWGNFRAAGTYGVSEPLDAQPAPDSPAERLQEAPPPPQKVNPPPATVPRTVVLKKLADKENDIDVKLQILADVESATVTGEAETSPTLVGMTTTYPVVETTTDATTKVVTVTKFTSKFILKGTIRVQIRYAPGTNRSKPSAYGRGRTVDDLANGNITIGFHESCHVNDHLTWMQANALPVFEGAVGNTEAEYKAAMKKFGEELDAYLKNSDANTEQATDETGSPTRSSWLRTQ